MQVFRLLWFTTARYRKSHARLSNLLAQNQITKTQHTQMSESSSSGGSSSSLIGSTLNRSRVCYFYDSVIGSYYYGPGHPMKPHRLRMTHSLLLAYGIYKKMEIYRPHPASATEMERFHALDYTEFLRRVSPENSKELLHQLQKFNLGPFTVSENQPRKTREKRGRERRKFQIRRAQGRWRIELDMK